MASPRTDLSTSVINEVTEHYREKMTTAWYNDKSDAFRASFETGKSDDGFGRAYVLGGRYTTGSAIGDYSTAMGIAGDGEDGGEIGTFRMELTPVQIDGAARWTLAEMLAKKGSPDDQFDIYDRELTAKTAGMLKRIGIMLCAGSSGHVARVSSRSGDTITLNKYYTNRFVKGDRIIFSPNADGSSPRTGDYKILAVAQANTATTGDIIVDDRGTANTAQVNGVVANDYIFFKSSVGMTKCIQPWQNWVTAGEVASNDSFYSFNRYGTPIRGYSYNASGQGIVEGLINAANLMVGEGKTVSKAYVSLQEWAAVTVDRDATKIVELKVGKMEAGFSGIVVHGANGGPFEVLPAIFFEPNTCLMGNFDNKNRLGDSGNCRPSLICADDVVNIDDLGDGNSIRVDLTTGKMVMHLYHLGQSAFPDPSEFCNVMNLGA